ncbi:uncharacterized protein LOC131250984 isoform X2 [Magnolia sinica]|uniref:uncharacterized protein LOC131250984 isoform X2 n=1 Tax=Magnolia sinica TaxID=86752 RepID=UPI002657DD65|nr:uncharacterized protein LOC131250984 isoform X2 [Magnolia sinica]
MAMSGFRHPQFSEDIAWLPAWLQPHQVPFSSEQIKDSQIGSPAASKDVAFLQGSSGPEDKLFSKGSARYSCCRLFLSGDDHSPIANTPSSGNVLHFDLHLSSDGISQLPSIQSHDTHQPERLDLNKPILETSVFRGDTCMPKVSQKSPSLSVTKDNSKSGKKSQEKFDLGHLQNTNIHDAVELSIAASEALAISELVKSGPPSEAFPAASILEMALRVKQARNRYHMDELEDDPAGKDDGIDETDRLSDLDENTMEDAFEDVGLPVTRVAASPDDFCGLQTSSSPNYHTYSYSSATKHEHDSYTNSSHVLNTNILGSHYKCDGEVKNKEKGSQDVDFIDAFATELRSKELPQEYPEMRQTEPCGDGPFGFSTNNIESHLNVGSHQPVQTTKDTSATTKSPKEDGMIAEGLNYEVEGVKLFRSEASMVPSPCIMDSQKAVVENAVNDVPKLTMEQFKSRWFGGWTGKDVEVTIGGGWNNNKSIPKFFITETSFLSESVDIVTDESSVQKPDAVPEVVSLSSIPLVAVPRNTNEGTLLSQDVTGSSNFSMADPLCSVVPCSISLDNDHTMQDSGQKDLEKEEAGKGLNLITEHVGLETIPVMPFVHGEENVASKMSSEGLPATTRKQLTSLRLYSMVEPARYTSPGGEFVCINESVPLVGPTESHRQILPSERNVDCFMSLNKEDFAVQLRGKPIGVKMPDSVSNRNTDTVQKEQVHQNIAEMANGIEVQVHQHKERSSPLVLNYGTRRRLKACNIIVSDTEDESSKTALIPCKRKTRLDDSRTDVSCVDQAKATSVSLLQSSLHSYPHEKQTAAKKKVRFTEAEVEHRSKNTVEKSSGYQTRSHAGAGKRVKASGLGSMFEIGKENYHCLKSCGNKYRKGMLLQSFEFLLTGFSRKKEKELEMLIRKHGGIVLSDVPSPSPNLRGKRQSGQKHRLLPVVLSPKKVETTKFLYGCAIDTVLLKANWLNDSVLSGSVLSPDKYLILPNQASNGKQMRIGQPVCFNHSRIFDRVGIMLYGKPTFFSNLAKVVKHGGGQVFKTLHLLVQNLKNGRNSVGVIVVEEEGRASRHLKQCASEQKLPLMPASWIIKSLHMGKLLSFKNNVRSALPCMSRMPQFPPAMDFSEEI